MVASEVPGSTEEMPIARQTGIPTGVHVVLEREGCLLLMRRAGTGFFDGLYSLPGGHVEDGESACEAAVREIREELGVELELVELSWLGVVHRRSDTNRIEFVMRAGSWWGEPCICEPDKCDRLIWCPRDALPDDTVPYIRAAISAGDGPWLLELGWKNT